MFEGEKKILHCSTLLLPPLFFCIKYNSGDHVLRRFVMTCDGPQKFRVSHSRFNGNSSTVHLEAGSLYSMNVLPLGEGDASEIVQAILRELV
jgi:hypothetical protein